MAYYLKVQHALGKMDPSGLLSKLVNVEALTNKDGVSDPGAAIINNERMKALTQPDVSDKGITHTLNGAISRSIRAGEDQNLPDPPKTIQGLVRVIDKITDPKVPDEAKSNVINYTFGGDASQLLNNFRREGTVDPVTGQNVKDGKFSMFERLAKPDIAAEVARIDKLYPERNLLQMYKDTVETWFGRDLLSSTIQELNKDAATFRYAEITYNSDPSEVQNRISVRFKSREEMGSISGTALADYESAKQRINNSVALLNRGLKGMTNVAEVSGGDVNRYLFNFLNNAGYNIEEGPIKGFPTELLKSLKNSREEVLKEQERLREPYRQN
jgi:hypothetical protein